VGRGPLWQSVGDVFPVCLPVRAMPRRTRAAQGQMMRGKSLGTP